MHQIRHFCVFLGVWLSLPACGRQSFPLLLIKSRIGMWFEHISEVLGLYLQKMFGFITYTGLVTKKAKFTLQKLSSQLHFIPFQTRTMRKQHVPVYKKVLVCPPMTTSTPRTFLAISLSMANPEWPRAMILFTLRVVSLSTSRCKASISSSKYRWGPEVTRYLALDVISEVSKLPLLAPFTTKG